MSCVSYPSVCRPPPPPPPAIPIHPGSEKGAVVRPSSSVASILVSTSSATAACAYPHLSSRERAGSPSFVPLLPPHPGVSRNGVVLGKEVLWMRQGAKRSSKISFPHRKGA
uniref:Uncharacterized protein n=1 Tax=Oryza punctata TaxID=4537 RepID=A0A0E0M6X5_ORYPU